MAAKKRKKKRASKKRPAATTKKRARKKRKPKKPSKKLLALMAAFSGESRHDDSYVAPAPRKKRLTKKQRAALTRAAMEAYSGESRHGPAAEHARFLRSLVIAEAARKRRLEDDGPALVNPRRRRKRKRARTRSRTSARNPIHFPKDPRGRPARKSYWILDVYKNGTKTTYIGARPIDKTNAKLDAIQRMQKLKADRVALSGPYRTKPTKSSLRK